MVVVALVVCLFSILAEELGNLVKKVYGDKIHIMDSGRTLIEYTFFFTSLSFYIAFLVNKRNMKRRINENVEELERRIYRLENTKSEIHDAKLQNKLHVEEMKKEAAEYEKKKKDNY